MANKDTTMKGAAARHNSPENKQEYTYALLQETNGEECESWYYFIRYQGNEEALDHLEKQLESVDWYTLDDLSTFVIETQYLVSERTAKEMTKVDLNPTSFHRKFDGKLQMIDLGLNGITSTKKKMIRVFDKISYGQIEDYIDGEDIDPEDMASRSDESEEEPTETESESESEEDKPLRRHGKLPGALSGGSHHPIPRAARAKRRHRRK